MIILVWMYFNSIILLIGFELNTVFQMQRKKRKIRIRNCNLANPKLKLMKNSLLILSLIISSFIYAQDSSMNAIIDTKSKKQEKYNPLVLNPIHIKILTILAIIGKIKYLINHCKRGRCLL